MSRGPSQAFLRVLQAGDPQTNLKARAARRTHDGLSTAEAVAETGWTLHLVQATALPLLQDGQLVRVADRLAHPPAIETLKIALTDSIANFQKRNPLVPGMNKEELRNEFRVVPEVFTAVVDALVRDKKLEVSGELVRLAGRGVVMKDEEAEAKKTIENAFATAGLKVPYLKDVLAGLPVDKARAQKIVTLLLRDKVLIKVSEELVFHRKALEGLRKLMAEQKKKTPRIDVGAFKDLIGVTRKYAIPLLEYLDRERVTRRVGDIREIL
jgi:selenocysteine-specific elongation factor